MASTHTVQQGEYLSMIAMQYGFATYITLWDHEKNKDLKARRKNPNVLFPGDEVFIPDKETKEIEISTEQLSKFTVQKDKLKLRLVLEELYGKPLANAECELRIDGKTHKTTADDKGTIEISIEVSTSKKRSAELVVKETQLEGLVIPMEIGALDPVTEESGQKARLNSLGYRAGPIQDDEEEKTRKDENGLSAEEKEKKENEKKEKEKEENEALFRSAVEEFQCDHKLTVDGKCGPKTQAKLKEVYGC